MSNAELTTERLTLRAVRPEDQAQLMKVFGDQDVMEFSDDGPRDAEWVQRWIDKARKDHAALGHGVMSVVNRETNEVLGYCGLFDYDDIDGQPEIEVGYRLSKEAWGKGYATEAASALLQHAHTTLGMSRVVAMIDPSNVASKKVAEKVGMECEKEIMMPGYTHPDLLYVSKGN